MLIIFRSIIQAAGIPLFIPDAANGHHQQRVQAEGGRYPPLAYGTNGPNHAIIMPGEGFFGRHPYPMPVVSSSAHGTFSEVSMSRQQHNARVIDSTGDTSLINQQEWTPDTTLTQGPDLPRHIPQVNQQEWSPATTLTHGPELPRHIPPANQQEWTLDTNLTKGLDLPRHIPRDNQQERPKVKTFNLGLFWPRGVTLLQCLV